MSSYFSNNIGLNQIFPACEPIIKTIPIFPNVDISFSVPLTRNRDNSTDYIVLYTFHKERGSAAFVNASTTRSTVVYNKTATYFMFYAISPNNPDVISPLNIMFLVIYKTPNPQIATSTITTFIENNQRDISLNSYYPEYFYHKLVMTSTASVQGTIDLSVKAWNTVNYYMFQSGENTTGINVRDSANMMLTKMITFNGGGGGTLPKYTTYIPYYFQSNGIAGAVNNTSINVVALKVPRVTNFNYVSKYDINNIPFNEYYPFCELLRWEELDGNLEVSISWTYHIDGGGNKLNSLDYIVIVGFEYLSPGSGGTYNVWEGMTNLYGIPILVNKTPTTFTLWTSKSTADYWRGGMNVLVIHNTPINVNNFIFYLDFNNNSGVGNYYYNYSTQLYDCSCVYITPGTPNTYTMTPYTNTNYTGGFKYGDGCFQSGNTSTTRWAVLLPTFTLPSVGYTISFWFGIGNTSQAVGDTLFVYDFGINTSTNQVIRGYLRSTSLTPSTFECVHRVMTDSNNYYDCTINIAFIRHSGWAHIAIVQDSNNTLYMYFNGNLQTVTFTNVVGGVSQTPINTNTNIPYPSVVSRSLNIIGGSRLNPYTPYLYSYIDDFYFIKTSVTQQEIRRYFNSGIYSNP